MQVQSSLSLNKSFFKVNNYTYNEILKLQDKDALILFIHICKLANYHEHVYLGNYTSYGLTQYQYRKAKHKLQQLDFIEFFTSPKGTIALIK